LIFATPGGSAELRREAAMLSRHPGNAAIDDGPDTVRDPDDGW